MPSRLEEPPVGLATVVFLASRDALADGRALAALARTVPDGVDIVVAADAVDVSAETAATTAHEVVRTSARLGAGAALNIGIRRARAAVVVVLDASVVPAGDIATPLVDALGDPTVAIVGPSGYASADLQRFESIAPGGKPRDVAAVEGRLLAFRRRDAAERGPVDEAFRAPRYLDVWWSLVLRDEGDDVAPRRAVAVPGLPIEPAEPRAEGAEAGGQERLAKRNFYRVLDRFRTRLDLAVPARDT